MRIELFIAKLHSFFWHALYGMWKGYRETKTTYYGSDGRMVLGALTSTDQEWRIVKVFWEAA